MERPLRIAVICHPSVGGSGVVAAELGMALAERGHEIHVVSHQRPVRVAECPKLVTFHEVPITRYPLFKYPPYTLALATKLVQLCRERPIDLLHAHYAIPHAASAYLCKQMLGDGAPKIATTLHGTDITLLGLDSSFYDVTRFCLEQSDGLTAVSDYLARETHERFCVECPIETIHNFIDLERFHPSKKDAEVRNQYARPDEALVGHLSNFRWVKRAPDVIRAFQQIRKRTPARLLMVGDGPELEPTRRLAEELGVIDNVTFLGSEDEVERLLAQLDLFLLPSEQESFGLAALEAMASGVPVIGTEVGGVPELVNGDAGLLFPVGDTDAMGAVSGEILSDPQRLDQMRKGARSRAEDFAQSGLVDRYETFYRRVLAG